MRKHSDLFLSVCGLAAPLQQLCVEVLVVGGSLGHGVLQGGDLLLGSAQTLLQPLLLALLFQPLGLLHLQDPQQLLVALTWKQWHTVRFPANHLVYMLVSLWNTWM